MEVNVPGFNTNIHLPDRAKGKNAVVLSQNGTNHNDPNFLSDNFPRDPPKLYITAESDDFDAMTLAEWRNEGFNVEYIPMEDGGDEYVQKLERLAKRKLGPCETFGIIAYGDAASVCLEHYHILDNNHGMKLGLLIAYYPTSIPDPQGQFPSSVQALVHLAGQDIGVVKHSQMVGIQGKRRVVQQNLDPGIGTGRINNMAYPSYTYGAQPGFAEHDLDEYDKISAELAWSRSLAAARKAFNRYNNNVELLLDQHIQGKFHTRNLQNLMSGYTTNKMPHVTNFPTLTGGVGPDELQRFYAEFFLPGNPPSMRLTLLSRTMGADRIVDEIHVGFKHTHEMPWILPGIPPTGKRVEVIVVSIVTIRGGKLYSEHVYWDQATVLVQTGLLDPRLVPRKVKKNLGVEELPVVGKEAARRLLKGPGDGEADNELLPGWYDDDEDDDDDDYDEDEEDEGNVNGQEDKDHGNGNVNGNINGNGNVNGNGSVNGNGNGNVNHREEKDSGGAPKQNGAQREEGKPSISPVNQEQQESSGKTANAHGATVSDEHED